MKRITTGLIARFIHGDVKQIAPGFWQVTTTTGRKIDVREDGIDFDSVFDGRVQGETRERQTEMRFQALSLAHEIWGKISTDGLESSTYRVIQQAKEYGFRVDEAGLRPFSTGLARKYFGSQASVKKSWLPYGWRVILPDGKCAVIGTNARDEQALLSVRGGSEIYEAALLFLSHKQGYAVVVGSREHVINAVLNASALNIEIRPEVSADWPRAVMFGGFGLAVALRLGELMCGANVVVHNALVIWTCLCVGIFGAVTVFSMPYSKPGFRRARRRGLELVSKLPSRLFGATTSKEVA